MTYTKQHMHVINIVKFISNKEEEKRLKSDAYQLALAQGVVKGVKRYMEEQQAMYVP